MNKLGEWGILVVLLAGTAGGFLYWQKLATAPKRPARVRMSSGTSGFQGSTGAPMSNPLRPDSPAPTAAAGSTAGAAAVATGSPAPAAGSASPMPQMSRSASEPSEGAATASQPGSVALAAASSQAMMGTAAPAAPSTGSVSGLFQPKSGRDPMQSVADRNLIAMYQMHQKDSRLLAAELAAAAKRRNHKPPPNPAAGISLEGIMTINGRLSALINGNTLFVGSKVKGARIVAITANSVTFSFKVAGGKTGRFKKVMRQ